MIQHLTLFINQLTIYYYVQKNDDSSICAAGYNDVNAITLAFYSGSTEVEKVTQLKSDGSTYTTFGDFSLSLPKTSEDVPFKRNRKTILTGPMYTNEALSGAFQVETAWIDAHNANTFLCYGEVTIGDEAVDLQVSLDRIVSLCR